MAHRNNNPPRRRGNGAAAAAGAGADMDHWFKKPTPMEKMETAAQFARSALDSPTLHQFLGTWVPFLYRNDRYLEHRQPQDVMKTITKAYKTMQRTHDGSFTITTLKNHLRVLHDVFALYLREHHFSTLTDHADFHHLWEFVETEVRQWRSSIRRPLPPGRPINITGNMIKEWMKSRANVEADPLPITVISIDQNWRALLAPPNAQPPLPPPLDADHGNVAEDDPELDDPQEGGDDDGGGEDAALVHANDPERGEGQDADEISAVAEEEGDDRHATVPDVADEAANDDSNGPEDDRDDGIVDDDPGLDDQGRDDEDCGAAGPVHVNDPDRAEDEDEDADAPQDAALPPFVTWFETAPTPEGERLVSVSLDGLECEWTLYSDAGDAFCPVEVARAKAFRLPDGSVSAGTKFDPTPYLPDFLKPDSQNHADADNSRPRLTNVYVLMEAEQDLMAMKILLTHMPTVKLYRLHPTDIVPKEQCGPHLDGLPTATLAAIRGALAMSGDRKYPTLLICAGQDNLTAVYISTSNVARCIRCTVGITAKLLSLRRTAANLESLRDLRRSLEHIPLMDLPPSQQTLASMLLETRFFLDETVKDLKTLVLGADPVTESGAAPNMELAVLVGGHDGLDSDIVMDLLNANSTDLVEPITRRSDLISQGMQHVLIAHFQARRHGPIEDPARLPSYSDKRCEDSNGSTKPVDGGSAMDYESEDDAFSTAHETPSESARPVCSLDVAKPANMQNGGVAASSTDRKLKDKTGSFESIHGPGLKHCDHPCNSGSVTAHEPEFAGSNAQDENLTPPMDPTTNGGKKRASSGQPTGNDRKRSFAEQNRSG